MKRQNLLKKRGAGVLMPISALPSPYGIGTLGKAAYDFVDDLVKAGQTYWQVLPVGPTSYGDSPYQSFSAFAGNPYFIDFRELRRQGLIEEKEYSEYDFGQDNPSKIDYEKLYNNRFKALHKAFKRAHPRDLPGYRDFKIKNKFWLEDYALFMAIKGTQNSKSWQEWPEELRMRKPKAIEKAKEELKDEINFWKFCQYEFYHQFMKVKKYANANNIYIIGDIPLYVALDSADVWVEPENFDLDEERRPRHVAGVPPDIFSADGQRWGNPIYNWKHMEKNGLKWWKRRMEKCAELYDVIRIDHFIGVVNYWSVPAESKTAKEGEWIKGPGKHLTDVIKSAVGDSKIIAEDLGVITPPVRNLINECGWPGMKILQFAFDSDSKSNDLPHNFNNTNCVLYGGTHDNNTGMGFLSEASEKRKKRIRAYLGLKKTATDAEINDALIRLGYMSTANTAIFQVQDLLGLGTEARMNLPSTLGNNWQWRMTESRLPKKVIKKLKKYVKLYNR